MTSMNTNESTSTKRDAVYMLVINVKYSQKVWNLLTLVRKCIAYSFHTVCEYFCTIPFHVLLVHDAIYVHVHISCC